eukprot:13875996-Ditylum_brightwellii.AAC.1
MENLAYAATASNNQVEMLVKTNEEKSAQLKQTLDTIKKFTEENGKLLCIIKLSIEYQPVGGVMLPDTLTNPGVRRKCFDPKGYCWSHAYKVVFGHTSQTCTTPREGHQHAATHENPMGGSTIHKNWDPNASV